MGDWSSSRWFSSGRLLQVDGWLVVLQVVLLRVAFFQMAFLQVVLLRVAYFQVGGWLVFLQVVLLRVGGWLGSTGSSTDSRWFSSGVDSKCSRGRLGPFFSTGSSIGSSTGSSTEGSPSLRSFGGRLLPRVDFKCSEITIQEASMKSGK